MRPSDRPPRRELILPDGYAELIFNLGNSYTWENQARRLSQRIRTIHLVAEPPEPLVEQALQAILHRRGNVRVDELSQRLETHYKALERK